jgi:4-hydroxy-2-oxoheptanedioate aldolase
VSLAARLRALEPLSGLFVKMPAAAEVEMAGQAGFDLVVVDSEHGSADTPELEHHLRAADAAGLPALVRTPGLDHGFILAALDAGAAGVIVPHVLGAQDAEAAVAAAHYPPRGHRGLALSTRAGRFGAVPLAEHLHRAAEDTCVVAMIEDAEAVPHAAEIVAVPGVSGVLIGPADLSLALGHPGDFAHPEVASAIDSILAAARDARVPSFGVAGRVEDAQRWRARGASVLLYSNEALKLQALRTAIEGLR